MDRDRVYKALSSDEIRVFLAFFLIFALFIHWGGVNSYSRYDLTKAIVEDGSVNIADYSGNTIDKVITENVFFEEYAEGGLPEGFWRTDVNRTRDVAVAREVIKRVFEERERIYSDKAPLSSVLAVPAYVLVDSLGLEDDSLWVEAGSVERPSRTSFRHGLEQFLMTLTVSVLFGSLLLVLLYRDMRRELDTENAALVAVLALGLATPLFYYSTALFGVVTASFFGYLSFYLARRYLENDDPRYLLVAGAAGGLAISAEYYVGIVPVAVFSYLWVRRREWEPQAYYVLAVVAGITPILLHNYLSMGNPLAIPLFHGSAGTVCQPYPACFGPVSLPFVLDPARVLNVATRLLVFPTRGLFFYAPILLVALPGCVHLYRKNKHNLVYPGVFLLFLLFNASWKTWMAGSSFGPRYLIPAVPFLALPLAYGIQEMFDRGVPWKGLVAGLLVLSFGITLTGFSAAGGAPVSPSDYEERFGSFQPIKPDMWPTHLQAFLESGPQSPLLEILMGERTDYGFSYEYRQRVQMLEIATFSGSFLLLSTAFLPVAWIFLTLMLLRRDRDTRMALAAGIALVLALSLTVTAVYMNPFVFPLDDGLETRLLDGERTRIRAVLGEGEIVSLVAGPNAAFDSTGLRVSVNGEDGELHRLDRGKKFYVMSHNLAEGVNTIDFRSTEGCRVPAAYGASSDIRCRSIWVRNISVVDRDSLSSPLLTRGWHVPEPEAGEGWMREKATLWFNSSGDEVPRLEVSPVRWGNLNLTVKVNGEEAGTFRRPEIYRPITIPGVPVERGWNSMTLESEGGCRVPAEFDDESDDTRCLSFRLQNFTLLSPDELPGTVWGRSGWYDWEGDRRWMREKGGIALTERGLLNMSFAPYPAMSGTAMNVSLNGRAFERVEAIGGWNHMLVPLTRDINRISLQSEGGCVVPAVHTSGSDDDRCLSFRFREPKMVQTLEEPLFLGGWHDWEGDMRWMRKKAYVAFPGGNVTRINLQVSSYVRVDDSRLRITFNGEALGTVEKEGRFNRAFDVHGLAEEDTNVLGLESLGGCRVPAEVEDDSQDSRCLSFRLEHLEHERGT